MPKLTAATPARILAVLALVSATGCDSPTDTGSPRVASIVLHSTTALAQPMRIGLERPGPVAVEYWTDGGPRLRVESAAALAHDVTLLRLRPGRTYRYEIPGTSVSGSFATAPLPADLAGLSFHAEGATTTPLVLLHLFSDAGYRGYAIVDAAGEVVWYMRTADFPFGATRRANGNFVFMDEGRGLLEVTPAGDVVRTVPQEPRAAELHHEVIATPRNTLLFLAFDARIVDGAEVLGEAIWEWTPETGTRVVRWSAWDHFTPALDRGPRFGREWLHANALSLGARGNVLLSLHYLDQVISISPDFATVEWRLGGVNATVPAPGAAAFSGQHTPQESAPGRVLLFDNAIARGGPSRALELEIVDGVARPTWEWRSPGRNYASAVSSVRRLGSGNTLVAFGMSAGTNGSTGPTEVYEVTPAGQAAWHLRVDGTTVMFRAEPLTAVGGELEVR